MDALLEKFATLLLDYGLAGLVILALLIAVRTLYNRNQELHGSLYQMTRETIQANAAYAASLDKLTESVRTMADNQARSMVWLESLGRKP